MQRHLNDKKMESKNSGFEVEFDIDEDSGVEHQSIWQSTKKITPSTPVFELLGVASPPGTSIAPTSPQSEEGGRIIIRT